MKNLLLTSLAFLLSFTLPAQQITVVKTTVVGGKNATVCFKMYSVNNGGIFWEGYTYDTSGTGDYPQCNNGANHVAVATGRMDANGDLVWAKRYCNGNPETPANCPVGDKGFSINGPDAVDTANMFLAKTDCMGRLLWERSWGGSHIDGTLATLAASDGGYLVLGNSLSNDGDIPFNHTPAGSSSLYRDIVLIKTDSAGNTEWLKVYGSSTEDGSRHIFEVGDYYYLFAETDGSSNDYDFPSTAPYHPDSAGSYLMKIDRQGNLMWSRCLGVLGVNDALFDERDSTFMAVSAASRYPPFYYDNLGNGYYFNYGLAKIDLQGQVKWAKNYGAANYSDVPTGVCKTADGNGYLVVGETYGETNPAPPRIGQSDGWIVWVDSLGNKITDKYFGSTAYESVKLIRNIGNRYIISVDGVATSKPFTEGSWHYSPGVEGGLAFTVIELWPTSVVELNNKPGVLEVYPNPAQDKLTIILPKEENSYTLRIYNAVGAEISHYRLNRKDKMELNTASWAAGNYTILCRGTKQAWAANVIIQH